MPRTVEKVFDASPEVDDRTPSPEPVTIVRCEYRSSAGSENDLVLRGQFIQYGRLTKAKSRLTLDFKY